MKEPRTLSSVAIGRIFIFQVAANIVVLSFIIMQLLLTTTRLERIQQNQLHYVRDQNALSLCAQHEMLVAIRNVARKLGLPTDDIVAPNVDQDECARLSAELLDPQENPP